ncbi:MAG: thiamine pyrophosphate-dependent dehydrogenase E1 component subunit alpha [Betaproteobacteria bacterium]|nr:MAG: thiamine pyrophosphate-dependent dehydrogenase E1 component subunit alpha [Betaproteobacteria bacterium]
MTASGAALGPLADPAYGHGPLSLGDTPPERLRGQLHTMLRIRMAEQHLALMRRDGLIGGPVHLGAGQEAVAVGVSQWLRGTDRVFGGHRSHSHLIALGGSLHGLFAEVLGKDTGLSRGMGGSMHLWDQPRGFYGSVPIVAGTVPLAVGAALAARMQSTGDVAVAYFGDGAVEEGVVQESLNLARMLKAPVLFVVENNLFSSHMHISLRQPSNATVRFAQAHDIRAELVDGNDVVAVQGAAERLVGHARRGEGPGFLEAVTYRWYGHVDWRDDVDVGVNRSIADLENWRARDPIGRLAAALKAAGEWSDGRHEAATMEIRGEIDQAWQQAVADPYPAPEALLDRVYAARRAARP